MGRNLGHFLDPAFLRQGNHLFFLIFCQDSTGHIISLKSERVKGDHKKGNGHKDRRDWLIFFHELG